MGKLWKDCTRNELALEYNGIEWGLHERLHCRVRESNSKYYVIPGYVSKNVFDKVIGPGMLEAQQTIEQIWKKRYGKKPIPKLGLELISEEAYGILTQGWETYKNLKVWSLDTIETFTIKG